VSFRRAAFCSLFVCLLFSASSSCVVRRRLITRSGSKTAPVLQTADRAQLLQEITDRYNAIHDFTATVDMTPALGSAEKSRITEYKDVRGYILFRKPADIRIIGLYPVVRNTAFDMVSNGEKFKLYVPVKNRFLTGSNTVQQPSQNKLENLRPHHFLEALLVRPLEANERVVMENYTDEENAYYILHVVHDSGGSELELTRTIWFSRIDLRLARQIILDPQGNILTDARYSQWQNYDSVPFPKHIEINRPRDEYAVVLDVIKADVNKGVSDDKFVLNQPPGTTLQNLGQSSPPASATQP
jgi:outer membrane lipoprotein-sorting protein